MKLTTVAFKAEHIQLVEGFHNDRAALITLVEDQPDYFKYLELTCSGKAFTVFTPQWVCLGCYGFCERYRGVADMWMVLSTVVGDYLFPFHRYSRKMVDHYHRQYGFHRVQAQVDASDAKAMKWAESLGFVRETIEPMKWAGPNRENYHSYARLL